MKLIRQRVSMGVMYHMKVAVYFFFGVKDFSAFRTHILSRFSFRGAFAFNDLTHFYTSSIKKKQKVA